MKRIVLILMAAGIAMLCCAPPSVAKSCTKIWSYGHTLNSWDWVFRYIDGWGGTNWQCTTSGSACGRWDWRAVYTNCSVVPTPDYTNNALYGDHLVREQAARDGITLPSDLGMPVYSVLFDDGSIE